MALQDSINLAIFYMGEMLNIADPGEIVLKADLPAATEDVTGVRAQGTQDQRQAPRAVNA